MVAQFGDFDFDTRPTRTARYLVTARDAVGDKLGHVRRSRRARRRAGDPRRSRGCRRSRCRRQRSTPPPVDRVEDAIGKVPERAGGPPARWPRHRGGDHGDADRLRSRRPSISSSQDYKFDISSISDDRPFFWHFTPFSDVLTNFSRGMEDSEIAIGERLLVMLLVVAVIVAAILLALPFLVTRKTGADRPPRCRERWRLLVYFAALGPRVHGRRDLDDPALLVAARIPDAVAVGLVVHAADRDRARCPLVGVGAGRRAAPAA